MKFKITRQVPGVLRYEFAALEIDGEVKSDGIEFGEAVTAADTWASEQRGKLSERVLAGLSQEMPQGGYKPSPASAPPQTAQRASAPPAAPQQRPAGHASMPAQGGQKASEVLYGPMGYPVGDYSALIGRLCAVAVRNGVPVYQDPNGPKQVERDFVRAAAWSEKDGRAYYTIKNTMGEYAADICGKFAWGHQAVSKAWERLVNLEKALMSDGHVELSVSLWKNKALEYAQVSYSVQPEGGADAGMGNDEAFPF